MGVVSGWCCKEVYRYPHNNKLSLFPTPLVLALFLAAASLLLCSLTLGAHAQRGRVTVVVSCVCVCMSVCLYVCMYVCLSENAILAVRAVRSIMKYAIVLSVRFATILKRCFS